LERGARLFELLAARAGEQQVEARLGRTQRRHAAVAQLQLLVDLRLGDQPTRGEVGESLVFLRALVALRRRGRDLRTGLVDLARPRAMRELIQRWRNWLACAATLARLALSEPPSSCATSSPCLTACPSRTGIATISSAAVAAISKRWRSSVPTAGACWLRAHAPSSATVAHTQLARRAMRGIASC